MQMVLRKLRAATQGLVLRRTEIALCVMQFSYTPDRKIHILDRLAWSEMFESFLANKFAAAKRFGLEGCETLIPGMKALIDRSTDMGVDSIVMGMPHRGAPSVRVCSPVL